MDLATFRSHPAHVSLSNIADLLQALPPGLRSQDERTLDRVIRTLRAIKNHVDRADPDLVSDSALANLQAHLGPIQSELTNAMSSGNIAHISNVVGNLDGALLYTAQIPARPVPDQRDAHLALSEIQAVLGNARSAERHARAEFENVVARFNSDVERMASSTGAQAAETLARIEGLERDARQLLAALGADSSAGSYAEASNHEQNQADYWRRITIAAALIGGLAVIFAVLLLSERTVENILARLTVAAPPSVIAVYASRQTAGHRQEQRHIRQLQLQFASLSPYLSDLPPERRADIKGQLTAELFRAHSQINGGSNEDLPNAQELLKLALSALASKR